MSDPRWIVFRIREDQWSYVATLPNRYGQGAAKEAARVEAATYGRAAGSGRFIAVPENECAAIDLAADVSIREIPQ